MKVFAEKRAWSTVANVAKGSSIMRTGIAYRIL